MNSSSQPVVLLFAFANDRMNPALYLRNLPEELRRVRAAMAPAVRSGLCETVELPNATDREVLDLFQDPLYRDRIAVFHFGGHASSGALLLESPEGEAAIAHAGGLARFLGEQRGLELVFLNGCSTEGQVEALLAAGVPAVIATSQAILDEVATELAGRFYQALAAGASIRRAYAQATAAIEIHYDGQTQRNLTPFLQAEVAGPPWVLHVAPGAEERIERWNLPFAAGEPQVRLPGQAGYAQIPIKRYRNRSVLSPDGGGGGEAVQHLSPYALSVPLVGRAEVMADLWRWMHTSQPVSVRVMTAPAGTGKTRLALELTEQAVQAGWAAGFLPEGTLETLHNQAIDWRRPTLLVIDDAASRARLLRPWLIELADYPVRGELPLRLLLLERHADPSGGWWWEAFSRGGGDAEVVEHLLDPRSGPYPLPTLASPHERHALLTSILERIGSPLRPPELGTSPDFDRRLAEISWGGEPLFLLMAGLVAARAGFSEVLALSAPDLGVHIARHEIGRIHALAQAWDPKIPPRFLAHLAAYITLCQGLSRAEVEEVVEEEKEALHYFSAGDPPEIYEALAAALPEGENGGLSPLLPDVVGEALVLEALGAASGPEATMGVVSRAARRAERRVSASLVRLAQDYGAVRSEPIVWLMRIGEEKATDLDALKDLLHQFPAYTLSLGEAAVKLTQWAVDLAREQEDGLDLGFYLMNLSSYLSTLGRREDALTASAEAVAVYRKLGLSYPEIFLALLAYSLDQLSCSLRDLRRWEEALKASEEAVQIRRQLASSSLDAGEPDVAMSVSLLNLSECLSGLGSREEALVAIEEAVAMDRLLASSQRDRDSLALSLNILGLRLRDLGRREAALAAIEEALPIYRDLASSRPDAFRPHLAMSLNNLSLCLGDLGQPERALAAIEEAVTVYRLLASSRPDAFRPDLANSLNNLSLRLRDMGRWEAALAASEEALALRRDLASSRPDTFRPDLAMSLINLSIYLSDLGKREAALAASEEALTIYRDLASSRPDTFRAYLAITLNSLSRCLGDLGKQEAALTAIEEGVAIYRQLASSQLDAFRPGLAMSLNNLSLRLGDLKRREAALLAMEEAVPIYKQLASSQPDAFRPGLAMSLNNLSLRLSDLQRREAALEAIEEAVPIYRQLASSRPDAFRSELARSLHNLSLRLSNLGRKEAALTAIEEAVAIRRDLALAHPEVFRDDLASSLHVLSNRLSGLGNREAALAAIEEAVAIRRDLALARPEVFRDDLASSLHVLSNRLSGLGNREAALAAIEEAVAIRRDLALARPEVFRDDLASSLNTLSNRLGALERHEEALAAIEDAVAIQRDLAPSQLDVIRPSLASSLNSLSYRLRALGRLDEALAAAEELVTIRRGLASSCPEAFQPDLASSLDTLSDGLSALGRWEEALATSEEAVHLLAPYFLALPKAHSVMATLVKGYRQAAKEVGREPDQDLLGPLLLLLVDPAEPNRQPSSPAP